ncbi:hypothetical protein IEQ34_004726 [Dendrobium chrysotoxum]|uniref:Uncharacterized protein n=1 Tax=Dendrobium chrysotoxum TaxID=161865 RepID=A0AAV7HHH2_DENCH|nr:hypothetical protein IEQ34_004726 [Dendrobium chrysotoxum]
MDVYLLAKLNCTYFTARSRKNCPLNFRAIWIFIPLKMLTVFGYSNISSLCLADKMARLATLRYLIIMNLPNPTSLRRD